MPTADAIPLLNREPDHDIAPFFNKFATYCYQIASGMVSIGRVCMAAYRAVTSPATTRPTTHVIILCAATYL